MQYGENTSWIPAELRSAATDGIVAASASIYDYRQAKFQEDINAELKQNQDNLANTWTNNVNTIKGSMDTLESNVNSTMENTLKSVKNLTDNAEKHMDEIDNDILKMRQDNAATKEAIESLTPDQSGALALAKTVDNHTEDIEGIQRQLGAYTLKTLTESEYENLETYNANTLYFVEEDATT